MTVTEATHDTVEDQSEVADAETAVDAGDLVDEELLVEEISIDGMCGVY